MSAPDADGLAEIAARIDDLTKELRRQGRAAIAAQAAAESCLDAIKAREDVEDEPAPNDARAWVAAIVPVADALDRIVRQAAATAGRPRPIEARGLWSLLRGEPSRDRDPEIEALAEGLRVLRAQLQAALEGLGVVVDRRTAIDVDPAVHRIVDVRGEGPHETVIEVVRPGYRLGERVVREAEVVVERTAARRSS